MLVIGLTGSSGSGKGYVCEIMEKEGIPSLDTDGVCHEVYKRGAECRAELEKTFGSGIIDENGDVDRKALGKLVYGDGEKYATLNEIAHRHIKKRTLEWIEEKKKKGVKAVIIDAPLLFESGFDSLTDVNVAVYADRQTQIRRIKKRDGIDDKDAEIRLSKQKPAYWYMDKCDYVLDNSDSVGDGIKESAKNLAVFLKELEKIIEKTKSKKK